MLIVNEQGYGRLNLSHLLGMSRMYVIEQFLFFAPSVGNPRQSRIRIPRRGFGGTWILDSLYNKWDSRFLDCIPDSRSTLSTLLYSAFHNKIQESGYSPTWDDLLARAKELTRHKRSNDLLLRNQLSKFKQS